MRIQKVAWRADINRRNTSVEIGTVMQCRIAQYESV